MVQYTRRNRRFHTPEEFIPRATKLLFNKGKAWEKVLWKHAHTFSLWQITCVERMLACGSNMMGAKLYKGLTGNDPYKCTLCGNRMVFTGFTAGSKNNELLDNRRMSMRESRRLGVPAKDKSV